MDDQFDISDVSIEIGSQFYNTFKDIQNTASHVFAEFVDNALQSYRDHAIRLQELEPEYKLQVNIDVEWEPGGDRARRIIITDNAGGIGGDRYKTAFMPGKRPSRNTGLNEKGMGLKTAACWLGDTWTVKTAALGEPVSRTMRFDLDTVSEGELQKVPVEREVKDPNEHYTWIEITNPTANCPTIRYIETIKAELSSIYRKSFRENEMTVRAFGENLFFEEYEVLEAPFARTPEADAIYWKKDFEVSFKSFKAHGFIGLLRRMSTTHNGIVVFRRGRAILGASLEEKRYTPKCLCGSVGSPRFKRVFGEVTIDGFEVSFNKNDMTREAFALFLSRKIFNMGFAIACNWLKELGYYKYAKPDTHTKDVCRSLELLTDDDDIKCFEAMIKTANEAGVEAYKVDKVWWLICSGNYYRYNIILPNPRQRKERFLNMLKDLQY